MQIHVKSVDSVQYKFVVEQGTVKFHINNSRINNIFVILWCEKRL